MGDYPENVAHHIFNLLDNKNLVVPLINGMFDRYPVQAITISAAPIYKRAISGNLMSGS